MSLPDEMSSSRKHQRSLKRAVSLRGIGLFTGEKTEIVLRPAPEGTGIMFRRVDLAGKPKLKATVDNVRETPRCTILGNRHCRVQTVEHVLSALKAFDLDNIIIDVDGPEIPSCDGSASPFVELIEQAGVLSQGATKKSAPPQYPRFLVEGRCASRCTTS